MHYLLIWHSMADLAAIATDMVKACVSANWTAAYQHADPRFTRGVTEFMNAETWKQVRLVAGNLKSIDTTTSYRHLLAKPSIHTLLVHCTFERLPVIVQVSFTHEDKIIGLAVLTSTT